MDAAAELVGKILACHPGGPEADQWEAIRALAERLGAVLLEQSRRVSEENKWPGSSRR
jgi:hypothetical protein